MVFLTRCIERFNVMADAPPYMYRSVQYSVAVVYSRMLCCYQPLYHHQHPHPHPPTTTCSAVALFRQRGT